MRVGIYARVSTEAQEARGTIGSQLEVLRARVAAGGDEPAAEFVDDGYSGARLDRPGLDALRDAAEAGRIAAVWCLSPDRLARSFAYQMLILDELSRLGVAVCFTDSPAIDSDPQARLLVQVQGVIAEYQRAKFAERERRGKLYRARGGEVLYRKVPYGYRRVPRRPESPAHLIVLEQEAAVVRRIFAEFTAGASVRRIALAWPPKVSPRRSARPSGLWPRSGACCATRPTWVACTGTARPPASTRPSGATASDAGHGRNGWRSPSRPSWARRPSRRSSGPPATTPCSAPVGPSPTRSCCASWCAAAPVGSSSPATAPSVTTGWPATTCVPITTRCAPAGRTAAAPSGASGLRSW